MFAPFFHTPKKKRKYCFIYLKRIARYVNTHRGVTVLRIYAIDICVYRVYKNFASVRVSRHTSISFFICLFVCASFFSLSVLKWMVCRMVRRFGYRLLTKWAAEPRENKEHTTTKRTVRHSNRWFSIKTNYWKWINLREFRRNLHPILFSIFISPRCMRRKWSIENFHDRNKSKINATERFLRQLNWNRCHGIFL